MIDSIIVEYAVFRYPSDLINNIPKNEIKFLVSSNTLLDFLLMKIQFKTVAYATVKKKQIKKKLIWRKTSEIKVTNVKKTMIMNGKKAELKMIWEKRIEGVLLLVKPDG